jgi:dolichol-phosphate mannosyltransferase
MPKVTLVVPAYNEESTIRKCIVNSRKYCDTILIVLSKKSRDRTKQIIESMNVPYIIDGGLGKGEALRRAIKHVDGGIVVFMDADGSHNPRDIRNLVTPIIKEKYDMVIGSRMTGGSDELHGTLDQFFRLMFSNIITLIINWRFKQNITDYQNGFRAVNVNSAKKVKLVENITTIEQEISIKFLKKKFRITEVPAHEYYGGNSSFNVWRVGPRYLYQLIRDII